MPVVVGRADQSASQHAKHSNLGQPAGKHGRVFATLDQANEKQHGGGDCIGLAFFPFDSGQTAKAGSGNGFDGWQNVRQELGVPARDGMTGSIFNENGSH